MTTTVSNSFSTPSRQTYTLNCNGKLLDLTVPIVMGILNITPDSFYDGGKFTEESIIKAHVEQMLFHGAQIIDIGAVSSRPGSSEISLNEELRLLIPVIQLISRTFPEAVLSIDTTRDKVAIEAIESGAHIINDISGGNDDKKMFETIAELRVPYVLMHMQGTPPTMQANPKYENVLDEVLKSLQHRIHELIKLGVKDVIIDPGFGFGKTVSHNFQLLNNLEHFHQLDCPILVGLSRKSMINKTLNIKAIDALNGTTVLNTIALQKGASILRVHDVKEAVDAVKLVQSLNIID